MTSRFRQDVQQVSGLGRDIAASVAQKVSDITRKRLMLQCSSEKQIMTRHEFIIEIPGHKLPLKIVASVEGKNTTVITNYPLKKGWQK